MLLLVVFVRVELGTASPLMNVRIFGNRQFLVDNIILGIAMMAVIPVFFFASLYGQIALDEKATTASLLLRYFFLGFVVCAQIGGRMLDRVGAKWPVVIGCALAAVGFALWAGRASTLHAGSQVIFIVMAGAGMGSCSAKQTPTRSTRHPATHTAKPPASPRPSATTAQASASPS